MARYSRVALYHKAQNASHNQTKLIPTQYKKDIVLIPEAKNQPVNVSHQEEDKKEPEFKPAVETKAVEAQETKMPAKAKRRVKKSTAAQKLKMKASGSKTKKQAAGSKKASPVKSGKASTTSKSKKTMVSKKPVKKMPAKASSNRAPSKKMAMKKPVKKMKGSTKKNTKAVLKRHTKKSK